MKKELSKKLKNILVTKVMNRIENLQSEARKACSKNYYFELTEVPSLRCLTCDRGACQECYAKDKDTLDKLAMNNAGMYFLCSPCSDPITNEVREDALPKGRKTKTTPAAELEAVIISSQGLEDGPTNSQGMESQTTTKEVVEELSDSDEDDFVIPKEQKKKKEKLEKKKKKEEEALKKEKEAKTKGKCRFFLKNRCKHGVNGEECPFFHPKRCPKWMKSGNEGCKKCDLFHPALCYGSLNDKRCEKSACTFIHLSGTTRAPKSSADEGAGAKNRFSQKDGDSRNVKLDCIMCPKVFNSEKYLTQHMNTEHSHKCNLCAKEFSHREKLVDHNCQYYNRAGGSTRTCVSTGISNQNFLQKMPQELGQKEMMQSMTTMMKEVMVESQQQMMKLFGQIMQQHQQPPVLPAGWRMAGLQ